MKVKVVSEDITEKYVHVLLPAKFVVRRRRLYPPRTVVVTWFDFANIMLKSFMEL